MCIGVRVKCLIFLSGFNKTVIFFPDFTRIPQYKVSRKSVQGESSSNLRQSSSPRRLLDCRRCGPIDRAETSVTNYELRCVTSQKSESLSYTATEAYLVSRAVPCEWTDGRTDRHDEADNHFLELFCEHA
jgi:hypothetical protein